MDSINKKHEEEIARQKLEQHPELVSADSSTHPLFGEVGSTSEKSEKEDDTDMMAGVKADLVSAAREVHIPPAYRV